MSGVRIRGHALCFNAVQDEVAKLEQDMDERHAAETAALEQRERDAAGPQEESTDILATDLYSFSLPPSEAQPQVCGSQRAVSFVSPFGYLVSSHVCPFTIVKPINACPF